MQSTLFATVLLSDRHFVSAFNETVRECTEHFNIYRNICKFSIIIIIILNAN